MIHLGLIFQQCEWFQKVLFNCLESNHETKTDDAFPALTSLSSLSACKPRVSAPLPTASLASVQHSGKKLNKNAVMKAFSLADAVLHWLLHLLLRLSMSYQQIALENVRKTALENKYTQPSEERRNWAFASNSFKMYFLFSKVFNRCIELVWVCQVMPHIMRGLKKLAGIIIC